MEEEQQISAEILSTPGLISTPATSSRSIVKGINGIRDEEQTLTVKNEEINKY